MSQSRKKKGKIRIKMTKARAFFNMFSPLYKIIIDNLLVLFLVNLFLVKLPPFYLIPFWRSEFLTSHSIARLITIFLVFQFLVSSPVKKIKNNLIKNKSTSIFLLIYFIFCTLSIIPATNLESFFLRYKDIVFSGLFLLLVYQFKKHNKRLIECLILTAYFNFFYQIFMFLFPQSFLSFADIFVYRKHMDLVIINLQRARIFIETYDEIIIPLVFLYFNRYKKENKATFYLTLFVIAFPSLLSNFRSRIVMLVFSFLSSVFLLSKKTIGQKIIPFLAFLLIGILSYNILQYYFNFSFVDRFALQSEKEDVKTIIFRLRTMIWSEEIANKSPFFGVGLGNYYDNLPPQKKYRLSVINWENKESEIAASNPHNIFALLISETGYLSFLFYLVMMVYFAIGDFIIVFKEKNKLSTAYIIGFWTIFLYSLVNPTTTYTYNLLFWLFRALII